MTEGLSFIIENCLISAVTDLLGNNPSVASGDTSLYTREARILCIVHSDGTDCSGYEMIFYYDTVIESTMIPEESPAPLGALCTRIWQGDVTRSARD